jgi:hypothetical protein
VLETVVTPDFFNQIDLSIDVNAPRRRRHFNVGHPFMGCRGESKRGQHAINFLIGDFHPKQAGDTRALERDRLRLIRAWIDVRDVTGALAGADLFEQLERAQHGARRRRAIHATLEARRRFRLQSQRLAGLANLRRREVSRLEHDTLRRRRDLRVGAAHHAADVFRVFAVGDHQHVRRQRPLLAVERRHCFARLRAPDNHLAVDHLVQVERVHRLANFEHHVVGDVDQVADGPHAAGEQAVLHPLR